MNSHRVPGGVVHKLPADLRRSLIVNATALAAWKDITPWRATNSSAGSRMPSKRRPGSAASAAPKRNSRKASADRAAGRGGTPRAHGQVTQQNLLGPLHPIRHVVLRYESSSFTEPMVERSMRSLVGRSPAGLANFTRAKFVLSFSSASPRSVVSNRRVGSLVLGGGNDYRHRP